MLDEDKKGFIGNRVEFLGDESEFPGYVFEETLNSEALSANLSHSEIVTVVDRVYDYINHRGMASTDELSTRMGIRKNQVEKIVDILEKSKLVEVRYSLLPGENAGVLVINRRPKSGRAISEEDKMKKLKKTVNEDVNRIEEALSSMEHHLSLWSAESEEHAIVHGDRTEGAVKRKADSMEIQRNLEQVILRVNSRIGLLNARLARMRESRLERTPEMPQKSQENILGRLVSLFSNQVDVHGNEQPVGGRIIEPKTGLLLKEEQRTVTSEKKDEEKNGSKE